MDYVKYAVIFLCFWVLFILRIKLKHILLVKKDDIFASKNLHYSEILGKKKAVEKQGDQPHDQHSMEVRVLAVDDDLVHLRLLETNLRKCKYHVTTTTQASIALKIMAENKNKFDLIIFDSHMLDTDEFKQIEHLGHNKDLPITTMMSAEIDVELLWKHQGWDFIRKPIPSRELRRMWSQIRCKKGIVDDDHVDVEIQPNAFIISHNPYKLELDPRVHTIHNINDVLQLPRYTTEYIVGPFEILYN